MGMAGREGGLDGDMVSTQSEMTATRSPSGKPRVLLVEDEPSLSTLVGRLLDEAGYEHVSISDHDDIAAAIVRWHPRCVILDSEPGSKGHERSWADAAAIRRANPELPVLMFTADPGSIKEARAGKSVRSKAAGYAGVLDKPFLVVEFLATLRHAVDAPQPMRDGRGISAEAISVFPDLAGPNAMKWSAADFLSMAVHELRTPLTSIDGQTQLAQRFIAKDSVRAADALVRVREQTKRMNRMIGDLLEHARVSVGALSLEVVTFDLGVATAITIGMHQHEDNARITLKLPRPVRIQGDPDRIAQIVSNLLDNAIKYSPPDSPIDVSMTLVGTTVEVRISDRGVGIPDDERDRLFAPFFRTSRTREISGTGLGLHISRRIAEQHHGRLSLESSSSDGTAFVLTLPLAQPALTVPAH
jgi:signal transduction histidine kinase